MSYPFPIQIQNFVSSINRNCDFQINGVPIFVTNNQPPPNFGPSIINLYEVANILYQIPGPYQGLNAFNPYSL
jgi:hypothetical protein